MRSSIKTLNQKLSQYHGGIHKTHLSNVLIFDYQNVIHLARYFYCQNLRHR